MKNKAATYSRAPETRGEIAPYREKFADLIKLCQFAKASKVSTVIIAFPWVIGDTYEEVIESLSRVASAGLAINIVEPGDDKHRSIPGIAEN